MCMCKHVNAYVLVLVLVHACICIHRGFVLVCAAVSSTANTHSTRTHTGGTYPVSAVLGSHEVILGIKPGQHGSTFGGNPLGCQIAIASLNVIKDEKLAENAQKMGELTRKNLIAMKSPLVTVSPRFFFNYVYTMYSIVLYVCMYICTAYTLYVYSTLTYLLFADCARQGSAQCHCRQARSDRW